MSYDPMAPNPVSPAPAPEKKKNTVLIVLGVLGGLFLVVAIGCCGLMYWGYSAVNAAISDAVKTQLVSSPAAAEHLGEIQEVSMNLTATREIQQSEADSELFVMDVQGSKGDGQLIIRKSADNTLSDIRIRLPDGTIIPADGAESMEFDSGDIDLGDAAEDMTTDP